MNIGDRKGYGGEDEFLFNISTPNIKWVCKYLDKCFSFKTRKPSNYFKGALFLLNEKVVKGNTDWLSQSAHSMREIFYSIPKIKDRKDIIKEQLSITQDEKEAIRISGLLNKLHKIFTTIAHHLSDDKEIKRSIKYLKEDFQINVNNKNDIANNYEKIIERFVLLMKQSSGNVLIVMKKIDLILEKNINEVDVETLEILLHSSINAAKYFYDKVHVEWISWLNKNGFFKVLNVAAEDKTRFSYSMPELSYLVHVVESGKFEDEVVKVMEDVKCDKNFNPEVVDRFLLIASKLSVKNLVKIVKKIKKEKWVKLMRNFDIAEYSYEGIIKKLVDAKEYESILILAKELLVPNIEKENTDPFEGYFYFKNIGQVGIFEALENLEDKYIEDGIEIISNVLKSWPDKDMSFGLYDVDLFYLSISQVRKMRPKDELKSLLAVFIELIRKGLDKNCQNAKDIFDKYLSDLPDSQDMWKIKMFAMSLCPKVFEKDLKDELNKFLDTDNYSNYLSGAEYLHIIKKVFLNWTESEKREYIKMVIDYFNEQIKEYPNQNWHKDYGWKILSAIENELTDIEREDCKKYFGRAPEKDFEPKPYVREITGGVVQDRSPVDLSKYEIPDLIKALKTELTPEKLKEKYKDDNFLTPRNAEGVGNAIKDDIKNRMSEYLAKAEDFCDENINVHYTYSFLRGIEEYLREKQKLNNEDWDNLFKLLNKVKDVEKEEVKDNKENDDSSHGWLARWNWVEKTAANILKYFLTKNYKDLFEDKREETLKLIEYFIKTEDPKPEDETKEHGDLFTIAINSTRGVTFQALVNFVYLDGEELNKNVLNLYKETIDNASSSVSFVIGHYLASFYYRDKKAISKLFNKIFIKDELAKFFAAWEGYLAAPVYEELFEALEEYYEYALGIDSSKYPERHERRDLDQGISNHLALAFAHFKDIDESHSLIEKLWKDGDVKKQFEFVSYLGRGVISRGGDDEKSFQKERLEKFWESILKRKNLDESIFSAFGFWVNPDKDVFDYNWLADMVSETLKKSKGAVNWDHGILKRLPDFANANPEKTLEILNHYLLEYILSPSSENKWFYLDNEIVDVFKKLYKTHKKETTELINKLLEKGGRPFWPLKDIVED